MVDVQEGVESYVEGRVSPQVRTESTFCVIAVLLKNSYLDTYEVTAPVIVPGSSTLCSGHRR